MNKFIELEKRFEKIMIGIENLSLKQSNEINSLQYNVPHSENLLQEGDLYQLSERVKELERAAKTDSEQIDKLIVELQSLLESKHD